MLNKVVFCIEDKSRIETVDKLKQNMGIYGSRIEVCGEYPEEPMENTLFVADTEKRLRQLKAQGCHTIALLHENNKEENLSAASYAITDVEELTWDSFEKAYLRMTGRPWTILETERCLIREMTVEDVDDFYRIYEDPSITLYMDKLYEEPEEERQYTGEYIEKIYGFYGYGLWSIVRKEDGRLIGRAGISWREGFSVPEIGFVIEVPCQRQGYAYEVCSAIIKYAAEELEFTCLQALVKPGNMASMALCRKLGMEKEDTVKDKETIYERYMISLS